MPRLPLPRELKVMEVPLLRPPGTVQCGPLVMWAVRSLALSGRLHSLRDEDFSSAVDIMAL